MSAEQPLQTSAQQPRASALLVEEGSARDHPPDNKPSFTLSFSHVNVMLRIWSVKVWYGCGGEKSD
jgi:hypothetical protein